MADFGYAIQYLYRQFILRDVLSSITPGAIVVSTAFLILLPESTLKGSLEELFKYNSQDDNETSQHFYLATLMYWLLNNELDIFDDMLMRFEKEEKYLVCFGIKKAIDKIEETIEKRFDEAASLSEDDEEKVYDIEEYKRVSKEIFKDF